MSQSASALVNGRSASRRLSWPWLRPIAEWFFCYPILFLEAAGLLAIVLGIEENWDVLGARVLGLPGLFWHYSTWIQLTAGFGVAAVLGEICLVGYLLDAEHKWMRRGSQLEPDGDEHRTSRWYFFATGTYPLLVLTAALPAAKAIQLRWPFAVGLLVGTLLVYALTYLGRSISPERTGLFDWMLNLRKVRQRMPEVWREELGTRGFVWRVSAEERVELSRYYHLHSFQVFVTILLAVIYLALYLAAAYWTADFVSPALVICVLLALMTAAYGFIVFHFPLRHFGVVFLLVAGYFGVASYVSKQYQFAGLDYAQPTVLAQVDIGPEQSKLLSNVPQGDDKEGVLGRWRGQFPKHWPGQFPPGRKPVLAVVATKGGGTRAAAWTTAVLTRLEDDLPRLPYHVRLISGASGGMLGAAYYVATLNPPGSGALHTVSANELVDRISLDSLSPVVRHLALPLRGDRGEALEQAWEKTTQGALARPLAELRAAENAGWCPSLVFAPMLVEDGRRLVISNLDLALLVNERTGLVPEGHLPEMPLSPASDASGWQFFELFPYATGVRLSTLARMNASFPYISPDAELATAPPQRVVDAAYYDAYGVNLAALWIHFYRDWLKKNTAGVVLIQIRDQERTGDLQAPSKMPGWRRALSRFTTPIEGAIRARDATMSYRNDELVHIVSEDLRLEKDPDFFRTFVFEFSADAPFSWYLPPENRDLLKQEVARIDSAFAREAAALREWWTRREGR